MPQEYPSRGIKTNVKEIEKSVNEKCEVIRWTDIDDGGDNDGASYNAYRFGSILQTIKFHFPNIAISRLYCKEGREHV